MRRDRLKLHTNTSMIPSCMIIKAISFLLLLQGKYHPTTWAALLPSSPANKVKEAIIGRTMAVFQLTRTRVREKNRFGKKLCNRIKYYSGGSVIIRTIFLLFRRKGSISISTTMFRALFMRLLRNYLGTIQKAA